MLDYTYYGTPVRKMAREDIHACLDNGVEVLDGEGASAPPDVLANNIIERLRIELVIRELLGEEH